MKASLSTSTQINTNLIPLPYLLLRDNPTTDFSLKCKQKLLQTLLHLNNFSKVKNIMHKKQYTRKYNANKGKTDHFWQPNTSSPKTIKQQMHISISLTFWFTFTFWFCSFWRVFHFCYARKMNWLWSRGMVRWGLQKRKRTLLSETHVFSSWDDVKLSPRDSLRFSFKYLIYCSYFIMATTTRILSTDRRQSTLLYIWQCPARFLQSYFNLPKRYCSITLKLPSLAQKWSFNSSAESNSDHSYLALEWHGNIQWP